MDSAILPQLESIKEFDLNKDRENLGEKQEKANPTTKTHILFPGRIPGEKRIRVKKITEL